MSNFNKAIKAIEDKFSIFNPTINCLQDDNDSDGNKISRYSFIHCGVDYSIEIYVDGEIDIYDCLS